MEKIKYDPLVRTQNTNLPEAIGDWMNKTSGNKAAQDFSAAEAQKQREWEEYMSNSAYTRAVADMKNAGLNTAAMYGGGFNAASTPSGASASGIGGGFGSVLGGIAQVINSAGTMASSMNSKNEMAAKLEAYEKANNMLKLATYLTKSLF